MNTSLEMDNGVTGAFALMRPDETWEVAPVKIIDCGKEKLLDIHGNLEFIRRAAEAAGGPGELVVVCEESPKNPLFGAKGNYANGRHGEFWRVLLTVTGFSFAWISPRIWHGDVLHGIVGDDTKKMAASFWNGDSQP
jgi:hypothetical protein